jgi:uncharacterized lipoprotein YmbA
LYSLNSTSTPSGASPANLAVLAGTISIPASVDRPQFVVQNGPHNIEMEELNRWSAPLGDGILRVVSNELSVLLGGPVVRTPPLGNLSATYSVTIDVQRFESIRDHGAVHLHGVGGTEDEWRRTHWANGGGRNRARDSFDALAAEHSRALATMSAEIATAIRSEETPAAASENPTQVG